MNAEIEKMQKEVDAMAIQIEKICKSDAELEKLYLGTVIYMSPLVENPVFLFLGINPGAGSYKHGGIKLHRIEPIIKSEYETEEYDLQNEWMTVFGPKERINNLELLFNGVKTNCCFFATEDVNKLSKLKSLLLYKYKIDLEIKEKEWLRTLLNYVNPKFVICEGFGAFNKLKKIYSQEKFLITEDWPIHKIAYTNDNIPILAFKRIYSRFADIEDVVDTIKDALDGKV
ncbi:MAG: hypothetical protein J5647_07100 [Spirochaetaceae bacterium]|nr:hypothetical protein [Spirochaetaceae bacterium]